MHELRAARENGTSKVSVCWSEAEGPEGVNVYNLYLCPIHCRVELFAYFDLIRDLESSFAHCVLRTTIRRCVSEGEMQLMAECRLSNDKSPYALTV
jgi:hypothetical protein